MAFERRHASFTSLVISVDGILGDFRWPIGLKWGSLVELKERPACALRSKGDPPESMKTEPFY